MLLHPRLTASFAVLLVVLLLPFGLSFFSLPAVRPTPSHHLHLATSLSAAINTAAKAAVTIEKPKTSEESNFIFCYSSSQCQVLILTIISPFPHLQTSKQEQEVSSWRRLGSFEKLLARRAVTGPSRLSIPHVCVTTIEGPPFNQERLRAALVCLVHRHPLLRACIQGTDVIENPPAAGVRAGGIEVDPFRWSPIDLSNEEIVRSALTIVSKKETNEEKQKEVWQSSFQAALDQTDFVLDQGPLWKLTAFVGAKSTALLLVFNHAISDQISSNNLIDQLLTELTSPSSPSPSAQRQQNSVRPFPPSIEEAVVGNQTLGLNTGRYLMRQGLMGLDPSTILPDLPTVKLPEAALPASSRRTICEFRELSLQDMTALQEVGRKRGLTVTALLAAAMLYTTSDFAHQGKEGRTKEKGKMQMYKFLLSLNMRAYSKRRMNKGEEKAIGWADDAIACAGGAMDFLAKVKTNSASALLSTSPSSNKRKQEEFWNLAKHCRQEYLDFVATGYVPESVILFDWGMRMIELNDVVEKEAENPKTLGRAYTCGVSNMGVFTPSSSSSSPASSSSSIESGGQTASASAAYGAQHQLTAIHYATSHSLTGSLYQLSCGTVDGRLCLTLHYAWPIVDRCTAAAFADAYVNLLRYIAYSDRE